MDITVVICTCNGAERVPDVLEALRLQKHLDRAEWEVIVIDNNSTDDTVTVVENLEHTWDANAPLRCVTEPRQGLAYASQRAVNEARGELVAFLDDDNIPEPDWVSAAVTFAQEHPGSGAFGGRFVGDYEVDPSRTFGLVQGLFALNEAEHTFSYSEMGTGEFPPGAGLVVRRKAWIECVPIELSSTGVSGDARANVGEDILAQWYMHDAGWEIWHNADMTSSHRIPGERFEPEYLDRFFDGIGNSRHRTRMIRYSAWQRPFMTLAFGASDLWKLARLRWRYRHRWDDKFVRDKARMLKAMLRRPDQWQL